MAERGEPLSDRELDVLNRLAAGESNKAIADGLSISPLTVKTHLRNIYTKLGVSTRTEAMTVALQQGVLVMTPAGGPEAEEIEEPAETDAVENRPATPEADVSAATGDAQPAVVKPHHWRNLAVVLLVLLVVTVAALLLLQQRSNTPVAAEPYVEQPLGETRWLSSRPLPEARAGRAAAAIGLDIYLIGGETAEGVSDAVNILDTRMRQWREAAAKPTAVAATTAAELFGEIYVPGGTAADGQPTAVAEAYSPSQDAWRRVAPLPRAITGGLAVTEGGFLYFFGGRDETGVLDTAFVYDPGADSWRPIAPMPKARVGAAGGPLLGKLYVVGGSDGTTARDSCYVYDPAVDSWGDCPAMLQPRVGAGATVLLNKLYVIGGADDPTLTAHGEAYDPNSGTWTVLDAPPGVSGWIEPGVAHVETRIYALGGRTAETLSDAALVFSPLAYQTFIPAAPSDAEK